MSYPESIDNLSQPTPGTIRHSSGISPATTVASIIQSLQYLEQRLGLTPAAITFTADAGTDTFTANSHGLANADKVIVSSDGTLPSPLATATVYFVIGSTANTFQLASTRGGSAIDITTAGSGTHSLILLFSESKFLTTASGSIGQFTKAVPSGAVVGTTDTQTLTNKSLSLGSNTITGTIAQFNTALTDADFATLAGIETLSNKTFTTPTIASFTNAQHNHEAATGGGTLTGAALTSTDGLLRAIHYYTYDGTDVFIDGVDQNNGDNTVDWTKPAGVKFVEIEIQGGGGGGAGSGNTNERVGTGGGGGGYARKKVAAASLGSTEVVTVGAAGAAGASAGNGGNGGNSSFGSHATGGGGTGGTEGGSATAIDGPAGGTASNGDLNINGQPGGSGGTIAGATAGNARRNGFGGSSVLGFGNFAGASSGGGGSAGTGYGAGGSAGSRNTSSTGGGAGTAGIVIIREYY